MVMKSVSACCFPNNRIRLVVHWLSFFTVVIVTYYYFDVDTSRVPAFATARQQSIMTESEPLEPVIGGGMDHKVLWPNDSVNCLNRTLVQIQFLNDYVRRTNSAGRKMKSILLVGEFYFDFGEAQRAFVNDKCPITECTMTLDAERYRSTVDAVVILNMNAFSLKKFLPKPAHQIWIANHWESPLHNRIDTVAMKHYVNWSSSYRHDSHIVTPYGHVDRLSPGGNTLSGQAAVNFAAGKTKHVAWFVSNCGDRNGRKKYVEELSRYVNVDIFGACGKLNCPRNNEAACFEMLRKDYKFYLAFENSNCHYYMTEKLFVNALRHNVIPVVMGARPEDYAASLPPHSFIHVDDFRSPRQLADYIHVLDSNDTLYNEYFRWKFDYALTNHSYWCRLCGLLHVAAEQRYVHWYPEYSRYWDGDLGSACGSRWTEHDGVRWMTWKL